MTTRPVRTRASTAVATRKIVCGEHLNPNGTLFGGNLMSWMDEVAFMCAIRFTGRPTCVTVNIDNITFRSPIRLGENIVLTATANHVGHSSIEIQVEVDREDPASHSLTRTNVAHLTFVCLNDAFKPVQVPDFGFRDRGGPLEKSGGRGPHQGAKALCSVSCAKTGKGQRWRIDRASGRRSGCRRRSSLGVAEGSAGSRA